MVNLSIPYEKQMGPWTCGAAALAMVYRTLGLGDTQEEIWRRIGCGNLVDPTTVPTRRLACDAMERGLHALILQVQGDWLVVRRCLESGACGILNHRLAKQQTTGHFSVVTALEDYHVSFHDPHLGSQRLRHDEFLNLWGAGMASLSVPGLILVVIAKTGTDAATCCLCGTPSPPPSWPCEKCHRAIPLEPANVLGCMRFGCPMRGWDRLFCPWCDAPQMGNR